MDTLLILPIIPFQGVIEINNTLKLAMQIFPSFSLGRGLMELVLLQVQVDISELIGKIIYIQIYNFFLKTDVYFCDRMNCILSCPNFLVCDFS